MKNLILNNMDEKLNEPKNRNQINLYKIGTRCYWNTIINDKVTRLEGEVLSVPENIDWPYEMQGKCVATGNNYKELVYHNSLNIAHYANPFNEHNHFIGTD